MYYVCLRFDDDGTDFLKISGSANDYCNGRLKIALQQWLGTLTFKLSYIKCSGESCMTSNFLGFSCLLLY